MADKALDVYLNDHLAGARFGSDLACRLVGEHEGTALGAVMAQVAPRIEEDRQTLIDVMQRTGTTSNPVKHATTWVAEKASRVKFSGLTSREPHLGTFMALETLCLGVQGKLGLWISLKEVAGQYPPLAATDLDGLIARAREQYRALEAERVTAGRHALAPETGG